MNQNTEQTAPNLTEVKQEKEISVENEEKPQERYYDELIDSLQNQEFKKVEGEENKNTLKPSDNDTFSKTIDST